MRKAKGGPTLTIRHARLEDAPQISDIHRSHVSRWYRKLGAEQFDVPYGSLSLSERWGFGGPWMSPETCSIHLNNLLLQHHLPFVAQKGDELLGEMELFSGNEGLPYGKNLHIGLLYVRKDVTGRGIGKALADKARQIAASLGHDTLTVASCQANLGFYESLGFERQGTLVELEAAARAYDVDISPMAPPLNMLSFARGMAMPVGRQQSSAFHLFEQLDAYALPEFLSCRRERAFVSVNGHPSLLAFVRHEEEARADVYGWSGTAGAYELATAALTILHGHGLQYANILVTADDYNLMADGLDAAVKGSRDVLLRRLK